MAATETGSIDIKFNSFTSLHRHYQWLIRQIHIFDDSDDWGGGELYFYFRLETPGHSTESQLLYFDASDGDDIEVNANLPPFVVLSLDDDLADSATVTVHAVDNDDSDLSCLPLPGGLPCTRPPNPSRQIDNCGLDGSDGACAELKVQNPAPGSPVNLQMQSSGHVLSYLVFSTLQVSFSP
jgi:hypothetical protein